MDKRYQVFVSSTYTDLQEARQEVMHALLELDCIPAGMELFPAANEDQWSTIKQVIDDCDYYVVILAGRYGSMAPQGIGYTEMEYRYAVKQGKPTIAFLHKDPESLPARNTETDEKAKGLLKEFRQLLETKLCKHWNTATELGSVVSRSLVRLIKTHPGVGWVRADALPDEGTEAEIRRLRRRVEELEAEREAARTHPPEGTEHLAQGEDLFQVTFSFESIPPLGTFSMSDVTHHESDLSLSWNKIFAAVAPRMINEATQWAIRSAMDDLVEEKATPALRKRDDLQGAALRNFSVTPAAYDTCMIQWRALSLIAPSVKQRSVRDKEGYWTLTPYGDALMTRLRAIPRRADK